MAYRRNREKTVVIRFFLLLVFIYYLYYLFKTSLFNRYIANNSMRGLVIAPFSNYYFKKNILFTSKGLRAIAGPILVFMPMGLMLPLLHEKTKKYWNVLLIGLMFSLGIEFLQYITKTGISATDDIILNLVGVSLGFLSYLTLKDVFLYA